MTRKQIVVVASSSLVVAALAVGGVWYWHARMTAAQEPESTATSDRTITLKQADGTSNTGSINLDTNNNGASNASGANIPLDTGASSGTTKSNAGGGANSSTGSNSTSNDPDKPDADFTQYDKYQDAQTALYGDITIGTGAEASSGKKLTMNYRGWLTNGTEFDQSYAKGKPLVFTLGAGQVIKGFDEAVAGMKVGGKRRLIVPPAAGYGATANGPIPANSVLVFDVELVGAE